MNSRISAVIITHNEEKNIKNCMSCLSFCNEIILVDDYSVDETVRVARKLGARVYMRSLDNDFSSQRNFGLLKAKYDWVLFVDADEIISNRLAQEIKRAISKLNTNGYYIKRTDFWLGRRLKGGENGNMWLLRLARRKKGKWHRKVHEVWKVSGNLRKLSNVIIHNPHSTVSDYVKHVNFHASIHAGENGREGKVSNLLKIVFYPFSKFITNFVIKGGIVDMERGFIVAVLMSFHSFLSWSTLYYAQKNS